MVKQSPLTSRPRGQDHRREAKRRTGYGLLVLSVLVLAVVSTEAKAQGSLVLWNTLGSDPEILNSEVGANLGIHSDGQGGVLSVPGLFGDAMATTGGVVGSTGGYLTMSPDDFFGPDKLRGTVEVWIQKRIPRFIPFQTPLVNIFGHVPFGGGYNAISADWNNEQSGLFFYIRDSSFAHHSANDVGWNDVPVGQWVHLAFVWDFDGIEATSDRLRIYRDGVPVATNTDVIPDLFDDPTEVRILGHHQYPRFGQPTAYMDNLKVWNCAKTDFSDRFDEGSLRGCIADVNVDIKPGSCPNPLNVKSHGVLPISVLGADSFDPATIDLSTVLLSRADGIGGSVAPNEGPPGPHSVFNDTATPFDGEPCDCHELDGDGIIDLSMKFTTFDVVNALELDDPVAGSSVELVVSGTLLDGTPFSGSDCIRLVPLGSGSGLLEGEGRNDDSPLAELGFAGPGGVQPMTPHRSRDRSIRSPRRPQDADGRRNPEQSANRFMVDRHLSIMGNSSARPEAKRSSRDALLTMLSGRYGPEIRLGIVQGLIGHIDTSMNALLGEHLRAIRAEAEAGNRQDLAQRTQQLLESLEPARD